MASRVRGNLVDERLLLLYLRLLRILSLDESIIFKVNAGVIKNNMTVYNASKDKEERIGGLFYLVGKKQIPTESVSAGDIGAS